MIKSYCMLDKIIKNIFRYSKIYKYDLARARRLLIDSYSRDVFDYAVLFWDNFQSNYNNLNLKYKENNLRNKYYSEFENPNVPISPNDTVMDIGVSKNLFLTKKILKLLDKNGFLYLFEPNVYIIDHINNQLKHYDNIQLYNVGLWNKNTKKNLYIDNNCDEANTLKKAWHKYSAGQNPPSATLCIDVVKLDDFCKKNVVKKIDYIKLNIEGAELEALKGAKNIIKTIHPKLCISVDHHPTQLFSIMLYLHSLNKNYKFYLAIHTLPYSYTLYASIF